jgi:general secretion pathway protein G
MQMRGGENMNKKGFTLIELLVVIAIIGLLSTLAVVALSSARTKGRDAVRVSDAKNLQMALELYYNDNNAYPTGTNVVLGEGTVNCLDNTGFVAAADCTHAPIYMQALPKDPQSANQHYTYNSADGRAYTVDMSLEGTVNNLTNAFQVTPGALIDVAN